ncbi:DinB family protein [Dyella silvatica]|uniref:DinB family protein n=1 Tax=Dyella silvatica TaxID=2992128 RepID=UPI00224DEE33|nr:DinB family protein [Dyella silvatica]
MNRIEQIRLMASYNQWMNGKLYEAALSLPDEVLSADMQAFFGSILGTLNHLVIADTIWLKRFATHPAHYSELEAVRKLPMPAGLNVLVCADIQSLAAHRQALDRIITAWVQSIQDGDLDHVLSYANTKGVAAQRNFYSLTTHFFNHQTHHRGQATTLLSQAGADVGVTDLLALIPDETC